MTAGAGLITSLEAWPVNVALVSTVPLPHRLVSVTVSKCPSLACVRLGLPG